MTGELTLKQKYQQRRRCWTCGRYTPGYQASTCDYCQQFPLGSNMRMFPPGTADFARSYGLRKSDMIDHATQHVPVP